MQVLHSSSSLSSLTFRVTSPTPATHPTHVPLPDSQICSLKFPEGLGEIATTSPRGMTLPSRHLQVFLCCESRTYRCVSCDSCAPHITETEHRLQPDSIRKWKWQKTHFCLVMSGISILPAASDEVNPQKAQKHEESWKKKTPQKLKNKKRLQDYLSRRECLELLVYSPNLSPGRCTFYIIQEKTFSGRYDVCKVHCNGKWTIKIICMIYIYRYTLYI